MSRFFLIFFSIQVVFGLYLYFRYIGTGSLGQRAKLRAAIALLSAFALILLGAWARFGLELPYRSLPVSVFHWVAYIVMGFLATLILYSLMYDLAIRPAAWARRTLSVARRRARPGRREFLRDASRGGVLAVAGLSTGVGVAQALASPELKRVEVPVQGLHPDLQGFKIAQISDVHIGPTLARSYLESIVERVNRLEPDLIALTGDFVDGDLRQLQNDVAPLAKLRAKHGVYFCTGNHEFYSGVEQWLPHFRKLGIDVLENEHRVLRVGRAKLVVGGIHDLSAPARVPGLSSDPRRAIAGAPKDADFKLLLGHQPKSCYAAADAGFDLQLAGHTHAGQFFPFSLLVRFAQPYLRGLNRHEGKMWVYVNQGTGYWGPPLRTAIPKELTLLELR